MNSKKSNNYFRLSWSPLFLLALGVPILLAYNNCDQSFQAMKVADSTTWPLDSSQTDEVLVPPSVEDDEPPTDPCANTAFCDSFEAADSGGPPAPPWEIESNQPMVRVDNTRAYSGDQSIRVTTDSGERFRVGTIALGQPILPRPSNRYYARAMIYTETVPEETIHWDMVLTSGDVPDQPFGATFAFGGQLNKRYLAVYNTTPYNEFVSDCYQHSNDANTAQDRMVEGRWACYEWLFDGPNNHTNMWVDGLPASNMSITNTSEGCVGDASGGQWIAPIFSKLQIGWMHYQVSNQVHELWIDDVAVSDQPIGCP